MANVQRQFEQFHAAIRVDYEMSKELAEKRDVVLDRIRRDLKKNDRPGFRELLQGSYAMKTGTKPLPGADYDIDVGLRFNVSIEEYTAQDVRRWVLEAAEGHTKEVDEKGPCIRVVYEAGYHLDLVTYSCVEAADGEEVFHLSHKTKGWVPADPPGLLAHIDEAREPYSQTQDTQTHTDQFRRSVRYLRRWYDNGVSSDSIAELSGLAIVLLCTEKLSPHCALDGSPDDRKALEVLAKAVADLPGRVVAQKPTPEYEDMFGHLTDSQMQEAKEHFAHLHEALVRADREVDPVEACTLLAEESVFGGDFPIPAPEDTAQKTSGPAVVTTSSSA